MPTFDAKTRANTQFKLSLRQQSLATRLRLVQTRHKTAVKVEPQSRSEAQSRLETINRKYSQRRFKTGQAYDMHIAVWGDGNAPVLESPEDPRMDDITDLTRPGDAPLRNFSSPPAKTQVSRTLHALRKALESEDRQLTGDEKAMLEELRRRDDHVRAHERAHMAAGGGAVSSGAQFAYQLGPDGKLYAIGGSVQIDVSPVASDPEATIRKMQQVRRAALAPSDPSPEDLAVAAHAANLEAIARAELSRMLVEKRRAIQDSMALKDEDPHGCRLCIREDILAEWAEKQLRTPDADPIANNPFQAIAEYQSSEPQTQPSMQFACNGNCGVCPTCRQSA